MSYYPGTGGQPLPYPHGHESTQQEPYSQAMYEYPPASSDFNTHHGPNSPFRDPLPPTMGPFDTPAHSRQGSSQDFHPHAGQYQPDGHYPPDGQYQPDGHNHTDSNSNLFPSASHSHAHSNEAGDPADEKNAPALPTEPTQEAGQTERKQNRHSRHGHRSRRRRKWYNKYPIAVYTLTTVQVIVFVAELIVNGVLTGTPIAIKPQFNPTIGPSPYVLINMGARFVPCMRNVEGITDNTIPVTFPCPNTTSSASDCSLSELCGMSGVPNPQPNGTMDSKPEPNQWYRFIVPIFLHAGIIHIGFNMLLQLTLARDIENKIGPFRFTIVYFCSGIFGFVLGGNYTGPGISSTGASGSLFGIIALSLLDLLYNWPQRKQPVKDLMFIIGDIVFAFVLGLLPGIDNFSHIGGFLMGLAMGICVLHTPPHFRKRIGADKPPYSTVARAKNDGATSSSATVIFFRDPVGFFTGRKPVWWAWWLVRAGALIGVLVGFILLLRNFYVDQNGCSWCKYLSCIPVKNWCDLGNLQFTEVQTPSNGSS